MHIGYLIQDFPPEIGAGPARATEMARRWLELGAKVTAVTAMPNRRIPGRGDGSIDARYQGKVFLDEDYEGIRTLRSWLYTGNGRGLRTKLINNITFMLTSFLHLLARRESFDVLIASSPPFLPHVSAVVFSRARTTPLILEIRDLWPDYLVAFGMLKNARIQGLLLGLERWLLSRATHVIVVTESFRDRVVTKGVPRDRIDVIPNGVALNEYYRASEPPPVPELEKTGAEFTVGYIGTFGRGQDLETVVRAAAILAKEEPNAKFVLVGDGPELPRLQQDIRDAALLNIIVLPPIARSLTRAFYNSCDICLVPLAPIPILSETVPSKLFEIMACERPLVACVSGEAHAILEKSQGGIRTIPGDHRGLASAIKQLRALPSDEKETMGRRARDYVRMYYDRTMLADKYLEVIAGVHARAARSAGVQG